MKNLTAILFWSNCVLGAPGLLLATHAEKTVLEKSGYSCGPLEQLRGCEKIRKSGTYDVTYTMNLLQKGYTDVHVRIGLIREKKNTSSKYFSLNPLKYTILHPNKKKTSVSIGGGFRMNFTAGESLSLGLVKDPISPQRPETVLQTANISLKLVPSNL